MLLTLFTNKEIKAVNPRLIPTQSPEGGGGEQLYIDSRSDSNAAVSIQTHWISFPG